MHTKISVWKGYGGAANTLATLGCATLDCGEIQSSGVCLPLTYGFRLTTGGFVPGGKLTSDQAFEQIMWPKCMPFDPAMRGTSWDFREDKTERLFDRAVPLTLGYSPAGDYFGISDKQLRVRYTASLNYVLYYWI